MADPHNPENSQPPIQTPPDRTRVSYASVTATATTNGVAPVRIERKKATIKNGIPVVSFTQEEIKKSLIPFRWTLVGKFGRFRPNIDEIRKQVNGEWGLSSTVAVSILNQTHVLFRFLNEADYMKVWTKENHVIKGTRFHVSPWSIDFDPSKESSKQSVWIQLPQLPINFFHEDFLASVVSGVGRFIAMDNSTRWLTRAQVARVCAEIDLNERRKHEIIIDLGARKICQKVIYENLPLFCTHCSIRGHNLEECKRMENSKVDELMRSDGMKTQQTDTKVVATKSVEQKNKEKRRRESTKSWVTRAFYPKFKKPMWRKKTMNNLVNSVMEEGQCSILASTNVMISQGTNEQEQVVMENEAGVIGVQEIDVQNHVDLETQGAKGMISIIEKEIDQEDINEGDMAKRINKVTQEGILTQSDTYIRNLEMILFPAFRGKFGFVNDDLALLGKKDDDDCFLFEKGYKSDDLRNKKNSNVPSKEKFLKWCERSDDSESEKDSDSDEEGSIDHHQDNWLANEECNQVMENIANESMMHTTPRKSQRFSVRIKKPNARYR